MRYSKIFNIGDTWSTNYGDLTIVGYHNNSRIKVKFTATNFEKYTNAGAIKRGNVKDPYHPTVAGVGSIGLTRSNIKGGKVKKSYHAWRGMLSRCYEKSDKENTYYGKVIVCEEWKCFEEYEKWYDENSIEGYEVDKDLTVLGCNYYSPKTCSFIPNKINAILGKKTFNTVRKHVGLPVGVSYHKRDQVYTAQCYDGDRLNHLGYHDTAEEAFAAYKTFKEAALAREATSHYQQGKISEQVYNNLINYKINP